MNDILKKAIIAILTLSMLAGCSKDEEEELEDGTVIEEVEENAEEGEEETDGEEDSEEDSEEADGEEQAEEQVEEEKVLVETRKHQVTHLATIVLKTGQEIVLELYGEEAPNTVENFAFLANDGFYDGLTFHRIVDGFVIQGGDPTGTGSGGSGLQISGEFNNNGGKNTVSHERGVISMARGSGYNSASSQFFIVHKDSLFLDGNYAAFGKVTEGLDVIDQIAQVNTNSSDKPLTDVIMKRVSVVKNVISDPIMVEQSASEEKPAVESEQTEEPEEEPELAEGEIAPEEIVKESDKAGNKETED